MAPINFQASALSGEIEGEIARRFQVLEDDIHAKEFVQIFREFVTKVKSLYGGDSRITVLTNGALDHGGGDLTTTMSIQNLGGNPLADKYEAAAKKQANDTPPNQRSEAQHALVSDTPLVQSSESANQPPSSDSVDTPSADTPSGDTVSAPSSAESSSPLATDTSSGVTPIYGLNGEPKNG